MSVTQVAAERLTQNERTEISDQRMFEAAVELIVQYGPAATNLKDVGIKAGYSRGLASHRFGSKDKLFAFVLARVGSIWLQQLKAETDKYTGVKAMEKALDQHYQFCVDAPDHVKTFYTLWFESVNSSEQLHLAIKNIHKRRHQDVIDWIINDPEISSVVKKRSQDIAAQYCATVIGIVYSWLADPTDKHQIKTLHDGLKQTMTRLLTR